MQARRILITGGTGSLGSALVERWQDKHRLTVLSRNPHRQGAMTRRFPHLRYVLADICNENEVRRACEDQDVLVHTAALKQLDVGEYHPVEFSRVNVQGTITVAHAWAETGPRRVALLISSDKAVSALNAYGASKKMSEAIFRSFDYSVLRYGNVVESRGAFLESWREAAREGRPLVVRQPEPTRFFLAMADAVELVEDAVAMLVFGRQNGIFVPRRMRGFSVWDVAQAAGGTVDGELFSEPLLPYEKQHEILVAPGEVPVPETDLLARIRPGWDPPPDIGEYESSSASRMSGPEFFQEVAW